MARIAMQWIIAELRRKIFDYGAEILDSDVYFAGDTIKLSQQFKTLASVAATAASAKINVYSPSEIIKVSNGTCSVSTVKSWVYYNFATSTGVSQGVWRAEFTGSVGSSRRRYQTEFQIRRTQRIWTDDELQNYLDRSRIFIGVNNARELLQRSADYKRYVSNFDTWEWATLYDSPDNTASAITPTASNLVAGEWTFTTAQSKELYVEGHCYNTYAASAECLEELAGDPSRSSTWSRGGVSHKSQDPLELALYYRRLAHGGRSVQLIRTYY